MPHFSAELKHAILLEYRTHSHTHNLATLAARHAVPGGARTVQRWLQRWNGTAASLERAAGSGRPRALTEAEVDTYIARPIRRSNRKHTPIHYTQVTPAVQAGTGKEVSPRTVRRYGKEELGARQVKGKKRTANEREYTHTRIAAAVHVVHEHGLIECTPAGVCISVSADLCEQIAAVRRKFQRVGSHRILVLDETFRREGDVTDRSIVLPGEPSTVETSTTSRYAPRYDMIACTTGKEVLPPMIYAPKERGQGVDTRLLLQYIRNILAQAAGALDRYPLYLMLDKASIHNEDKIIQAFHDWGCQELVEVVKIPTASAKRLSPLDNSLFNVWRQRVLASGPLTKQNIRARMSNAWNSITTRDLRAQYRRCGLMRGQNVYMDCPQPAAHQHTTR